MKMAQQTIQPEVHIHQEVQKGLTQEIVVGVMITILAAIILAIVTRKKK